ncbi:hypothetical protein TIFTF001_020439 [Ficus carica]|uniref:RanBP2-type domain-containing protein n=1 Tax=Ficus carica TaxID=3494 RepID=A0AA88ARK8_FICCA|nr:hypothetical protein TIFTF001_020439 [Ficus carica]
MSKLLQLRRAGILFRAARAPSSSAVPSLLCNRRFNGVSNLTTACAFLAFHKTNSQGFLSDRFGSRAFFGGNETMKKGDWTCTQCSFVNFARNIRCLKCKAEGPKKVDVDNNIEMKKGDWICAGCQFINFARNRKCFRCQEPRPKGQLNPGEWECPSCYFLNFSRNTMCLKCKQERPAEAATNQYEEQI